MYILQVMPVTPGTYATFLQWLEAHMLACPFKKYFHMECLGCGLQRSILLLLKGDVAGSIRMYPATLPILATLAFLLLHLWFRFRHGAAIIKCMQLFVAIVITGFYIYKIIQQQIVV